MSSMFSYVALAILATLAMASSSSTCPPCGGLKIPYPLSTTSNCGNPNYKLYCNNGVLQFLSVGGTYHKVISINPNSYKFIISPPLLDPSTCSSSDLFEGGLIIADNSPFNISKSNTVFLLNCSSDILLSPLNCSRTSPCQKFQDIIDGGCRGKLCCSYLKDSAMTSRRIRVRVGGCSAYTSVVNLNPNEAPNKWYYGIELQWLPL